MTPFRPLLLAGIMMAGVTALAGYAYAGQGGLTTLILQLPGGSVQQIEYPAPAVQQALVMPGAIAAPVAFFAPALPATVQTAATDPFVQFEQISALMDAQAAAMMRAMNVMMAPAVTPVPGALVPATFGPLPPGGSESYSFISATSSGSHGACVESVQITATGPGQAPKVVSRRAGDCAGGSPFGQSPAVAVVPHLRQPVPALPAVTAPATAPAPKLIRARAEMPVPVPHPSQT